AGTGDPAVIVLRLQRPFAEQAVIVEVGILVPGLITVIHPATPAVLVALGVHTGDQLMVAPLPGGCHTSTQGAAVDIGGHQHHARRTQTVVVHDVVGVVVIDPRVQLLQHIAQTTFLEAQRHALAFELAAIHAAAGITGLTVAATDGKH